MHSSITSCAQRSFSVEPINVKKMHIGSTRNQSICGPLYIDGWKETDVASVETEITQNKDAYESKTFLETN